MHFYFMKYTSTLHVGKSSNFVTFVFKKLVTIVTMKQWCLKIGVVVFICVVCVCDTYKISSIQFICLISFYICLLCLMYFGLTEIPYKLGETCGQEIIDYFD
jgi:hypothetical protein